MTELELEALRDSLSSMLEAVEDLSDRLDVVEGNPIPKNEYFEQVIDALEMPGSCLTEPPEPVDVPQNTDELPEGTSNFYFTEGRVRETDLEGLNTNDYSVVVTEDSILESVGKLQGQLNAIATRPMRGHQLFCDFDYGNPVNTNERYDLNASGSAIAGYWVTQQLGLIPDYQSLHGVIGVGNTATGAGVNDEIHRYTGSETSNRMSYGSLWTTGAKYSCIFRLVIIGTLPSATENYQGKIGFQHLKLSRSGANLGEDWFTTSTNDNGDGAAGYFWFDKDSLFFKCVSGVGALTQTTTTEIVVELNKIYVFQVKIIEDGTVQFFIDNTLVASHIADGVITGARHVGECARISNKNTSGDHTTAPRGYIIDAIGYQFDFPVAYQRNYLKFV